MKHTPVTDKYLDKIEYVLMSLSDFERNSTGGWSNKYLFFNSLTGIEDDVSSIDFNEIKREFWESCTDFDKIIPLKHVFQIKFDKLLNSRVCSIDDMGDYFGDYLEEKDLLIERYESSGIKFTEGDKEEIERAYTSIMCDLAMLKAKIIELLDEWHQMGIKANERTELIPKSSKFKLAHNKKTDFIKIISAMYDNRMFETEDGYLASNKQELMNEFGKIVGEDLSKYSGLLSKSKIPAKDIFLKPFKDIEKKAEEYYDK